MKSVIMAGGKGTRLRPLTSNLPKPMVPIANKPILVHIIELLKRYGFKDIIVTVGYLGKKISEIIGDGSDLGVNITYAWESRPLGTAGGIKAVEKQLDETFLVISSDILTDIDLSRMLEFHRKNKSVATLALTRTEVPVAYGIVYTDEDGKIKRFMEKPGWSEVFSDKINTGIYILEPEVLQYIEENQEYDFSKQLFPLLLDKDRPIFGYWGDFYWLDIGNPKKYIQANHDILIKKVKTNIAGEEIKEDIWVGEGSDIDLEANLWSPIIIGQNCKIAKDANIDRLSTIGDGVYIGKGVHIKRSIVWNNVTIRENAKLENCVISSRVELGAESFVLNEAVIGDDCEIGNESVINPAIMIWPNKIIEAGSTVSMNVKWGTFVRRSLFGRYGITGLINIEITPEFASKLGAAFGTILGAGAKVVIGRDNKNISRMIKRALIAGLMSTGVEIYNVEIMPVPLIKYGIRVFNANAGISVKNPYADINLISIRFFDQDGVDVNSKRETEIEDIFFKEKIKRVEPLKVGQVLNPVRTFEVYFEDIMKYINHTIIRTRQPKIILDCANGSSSIIAPSIFQKLGCEVISLNAQLTPGAEVKDVLLSKDSLADLSKTVRALDAEVGIALDEDAGRALFVDNKGDILKGDTALALLIKSRLHERKGGRICVPVSASQVIEQVCEQNGGNVIRTRIGYRPLIEKIIEHKSIFGGDETGGFVFPEFQFARDGILAAAYLIEQIVKEESQLSDLASEIPRFYMAKKIIPVPFQYRGKVMLNLIEEAYEHNLSTLDGVKIYFDYGWCLIRPAADENSFEIYSEAKGKGEATQLNKHWANVIEDIVHSIETGT
ncbi:MAG: NTP transferase domain-containing protein [Candidatus Helarchaeota archaeon]|nr:NTP transferase domain-containing protein [Candidatus Helarchaeota archaeon]